MIFFKKQQFVVDCFTDDIVAYEKYPIAHAKNFYPEWLKKTSSSYQSVTKNYLNVEMSTIKRCPGLLDTYKSGFIIPMWSDLIFESTTNGFSYQFADNKSFIESHAKEQWQTFADPLLFNHIKMRTPWLIKSNKNIDCNFAYPFWNHSLHTDYFFPSAIINYKYQRSTNINMFIHAQSKFTLNAGQPIVHVMPLTEKELVIKTHLISTVEMHQMHNQAKSNTFNLQYLKHMKFMENKEKKCPFNFGK